MNLFGMKLPYAWRKKTAEELAQHIVSKDALTPSSFTEEFKRAVELGANPKELSGTLALSDGVMDGLRTSIHNGDKAQVASWLLLCALQLDWSDTTILALNAAVAESEINPTVEDVIVKLGEIGFIWSSENERWEDRDVTVSP